MSNNPAIVRQSGPLVVGAWLAHPERAAALGLRAHVPMPWLPAPDRDVDAMAEIAAGEAAAWVVGVWVEGCEVHGAIVSHCLGCEQRLSLRVWAERG